MSENNRIFGINGPVVTIRGKTTLSMLEMVYVGEKRLVGEVIALDKDLTTIQVYEDTAGLAPGEPVSGTGTQLCAELDTIRTALQKSSYAQSGAMLTRLSAQIARAAAGAKLTLSQLTTEENGAAPLFRFLSQAGDYTAALCSRVQSGKKLTQKQTEGLRALSLYADRLSAAANEIRTGLDDDTVCFFSPAATLPHQKTAARTGFDEAFSAAGQKLGDSPALPYDGPFSDNRLKQTAGAAAALDEISPQTAKSRAAKYLGCAEAELVRESDEESALTLYCYSRGGRSVGLTRRGGLLCYLTNANFAGKSEISTDAAVRAAQKYLSEIGYKNMKPADRSTYDGVCTIDFVYSEKGVRYDADRIRVSVSLDNAAVAAVDARPFLMHHVARVLPKQTVSRRQAVSALADELDLLDYSAALIARDDGTEALCHALHCRGKDGREVYVFADSGRPEETEIRLVTRDGDGVLAK